MPIPSSPPEQTHTLSRLQFHGASLSLNSFPKLRTTQTYTLYAYKYPKYIYFIYIYIYLLDIYTSYINIYAYKTPKYIYFRNTYTHTHIYTWRHRICRFDPWVRKIPWRRPRQPTPVFLPGESHWQRSLAGYSPQDLKESDMTEATEHACMHTYI